MIFRRIEHVRRSKLIQTNLTEPDVELNFHELNASVNSSWAQRPHPPTPGYFGAFAHLVSPGGGAFAKFSLPRGRAFANPRGQPRAFDTQLFPIRILLSRGFYWEKKLPGSSVKDGKKLKRFVKAFSRFYACISSLLIKPVLHSDVGSYRREPTFFGH